MEEKQRERGKKKRNIRWGRVIGAIIVVITIIAISMGIYSMISSSPEEEVKRFPKEATVDIDFSSIKTSYILLVGVDEQQPQQADAIYLLAFNQERKTLQVIGIPSNSKIVNRHNEEPQRLGDMYSQGGMTLTKAVVEDLFHISIPYHITVDKQAFLKMMQIVGSPSMYVEETMYHKDALTGNVDINIHQGYQELTDESTYAYMRYLGSDSNSLYRVMRQERVLKGIVNQETNHVALGTAFRVWQLWNHLGTNISTWDGIRLATTVQKFPHNQVRFYIVPGLHEVIDGVAYWEVDPIEIQQLVGITVGDIPGNVETIPMSVDSSKGVNTTNTSKTPNQETINNKKE